MKIEKLYPACKSIIWGGEKLKKYYGKETELSPLAETWELSLHEAGQSTLSDGRPLSEVASGADFGENCEGFPFFPVLVKLIDANAKLSIQVHPEDEFALKNENSLGKTEMWYIVSADEGAGIYLGFNRDITPTEFENAIKNKTLTDYLNFIPVKAGDCYFIPAGTIHAICEGCLICEIQQNSNITYRVYDYGRRDKDGNERELHIEKAIQVTKLQKYEKQDAVDAFLGASKYFTAKKVVVDGSATLTADDKSFNHLSCVSGAGEIDGMKISQGDSFFVPAGYGSYTLSGDMTVIVTDIRKYMLSVAVDGGNATCDIVNDLGDVIISAETNAESIACCAEALLKRVNMTSGDLDFAIVTPDCEISDEISKKLKITVKTKQ